MRSRFLAALLILAGPAAAATADDPATAERSTGNLASELKPPVPREPIQVAIPAGENRKLVEGKVSRSSPAVVLWAAPQGAMLTAELVGNEGQQFSIVVFQPGAETSDGGTRPEDGAIRWIGANGKSGDLRIEVHTRSEAEVPFKLGLISAAALAQP